MKILAAILLIFLVTLAESATWVEVSSYSTRFSSAEVGRAENIRLAAKILNGKKILPGSEFSFSNTIGPRTANAGFRRAPYLEGPEKVMVEGGGICPFLPYFTTPFFFQGWKSWSGIPIAGWSRIYRPAVMRPLKRISRTFEFEIH